VLIKSLKSMLDSAIARRNARRVFLGIVEVDFWKKGVISAGGGCCPMAFACVFLTLHAFRGQGVGLSRGKLKLLSKWKILLGVLVNSLYYGTYGTISRDFVFSTNALGPTYFRGRTGNARVQGAPSKFANATRVPFFGSGP